MSEGPERRDGGAVVHRRWWFATGLIAVLMAFLGVMGMEEVECPDVATSSPVPGLDLSSFSPDDPECRPRLLFIHHSCGGQWLAPPGLDDHTNCIYESAMNGGDLRTRLAHAGYEVHEASYGSQIGQNTDIFDWPDKFRGQMADVLRCDQQDVFYDDDRRNHIVLFKPCFPNNLFVGAGHPPGNEQGPRLTVANAMAAYRSLLPNFRQFPDVLFVAITAPPMACPSEPRWKALAKRVLGRPNVAASGAYARSFNDWLKDPRAGWLSAYDGRNVVVFDLYDVLTDQGISNFSRYATGSNGGDSHPSAVGNSRATELFVPFLNRAVRRAGLCASVESS